MKNLKKLPTKQLEKFSNIFTQLGLVLVLFIVYVTLEHKTPQKTVAILSTESKIPIFIEPDETIVFQKEKKVVNTPKVVQPKVFIPEEVVKAENHVPETIIDTKDEEPLIVTPDELVTIDIPEDDDSFVDDVPFMMIEDAPVFKGCEGLSKKENKRCFDKKMKQFVQRNFDAELANEIGLNAGKYRIQTQFIIDDKGNVIDIQIRAPHQRLEKETNRLINKLPKFTPGKQRNQPVKVRYTLPISFSIQ
ncbi:energy transducer TonB [Polaribacter sp.]|uniref:energy transducer TonB n=1 Tax=Polaribacter sp. TaxID=1920175 RepID=UPI003F6CAEE1